ncbi:MAG: metalloregulator ArsR/SmtB family transcription factor [Candidatus Promineofilum sp.]|nr:metalloregulator ArsR/SmtB family transcription factor [Promineifilum sp.]MCW5861929.1 winged helix-turn-helix transcriptional regulator [Anaerolineae bacterium]
MIDSLDFAKVMADETRQRIMALLCCRWLCVGDIVGEMQGISQPTVSHHLAVLRDAGLVHTRRDGKQVFYSLNQDEVAVCCGRILRNFAPQVPVAAISVSE